MLFMIKTLKIKLFFVLLMGGVSFLPGLVLANESKMLKDYHMTMYQDAQGSLDGVELFTKEKDKRVFFGLTCSTQSPFPMLQVILFDDNIMSETTKLLSAKLFIDGVEQTVDLQAILKAVDTVDELSNKIRIELVAKRGSSMGLLEQQYQGLIKKLEKGQTITVQLSHRTLDTKTVKFSLSGLGDLLKSNESLCF